MLLSTCDHKHTPFTHVWILYRPSICNSSRKSFTFDSTPPPRTTQINDGAPLAERRSRDVVWIFVSGDHMTTPSHDYLSCSFTPDNLPDWPISAVTGVARIRTVQCGVLSWPVLKLGYFGTHWEPVERLEEFNNYPDL